MYTKEIFLKFQDEVAMMSGCISATQIHVNGSVITYIVKERDAGNTTDVRNFEVIYDKVGQEVRCICSCFYFKGFLCRHALYVLSYNDVHEVPSHYVQRRWRKDIKRFYTPDIGSNCIDISNPLDGEHNILCPTSPLQWFDHLYRRTMQVVEEGMSSHDHYIVAWQALKESLDKVQLIANNPGTQQS